MGLKKKIEESLQQFEVGMKKVFEERQAKLEEELKRILPQTIGEIVNEELDKRGYKPRLK